MSAWAEMVAREGEHALSAVGPGAGYTALRGGGAGGRGGGCRGGWRGAGLSAARPAGTLRRARRGSACAGWLMLIGRWSRSVVASRSVVGPAYHSAGELGECLPAVVPSGPTPLQV